MNNEEKKGEKKSKTVSEKNPWNGNKQIEKLIAT